MEIKKITDKTIWEEFIKARAFNSHFQSWNWMEFEKGFGHRVETFGLYNDGQLVGVFPIKTDNAKRGKRLHLRHGPIFKDMTKLSYWQEFIRFIKTKAKKEKCWFVRFSPLILKSEENNYKEILSNFKECPMHDVDGEYTWVLDLSLSQEDLLKNMRKNTRYGINKAKKDGIEIIKTKDLKYYDEFWAIYSDTVKRQQWSAYTKDYIKKEFEIFAKDDQIDLYLAKYQGKFIAASLIVYYGNQAIYHHSGTLTEYQKYPASYLIQWEAINESKKRGLKYYNFWGISPVEKDQKGEYKIKEGHPWEGLSFFKLGFGGEVRQFIHAKDLPVSPLYFLTNIYERIERKRRGY